jgi:hypothetical protein
VGLVQNKVEEGRCVRYDLDVIHSAAVPINDAGYYDMLFFKLGYP